MLLTTAAVHDKIAVETAELPELEKIILIDSPNFTQSLERASDQFELDRDQRQRSSHFDLHLRHYRPTQRRIETARHSLRQHDRL